MSKAGSQSVSPLKGGGVGCIADGPFWVPEPLIPLLQCLFFTLPKDSDASKGGEEGLLPFPIDLSSTANDYS